MVVVVKNMLQPLPPKPSTSGLHVRHNRFRRARNRPTTGCVNLS